MSVYLHEHIGATRVMEIEELLEMTLQYLSPEDLRGMERVNKTWNRVIKGAQLRKALFLDPETSVYGIAPAIYPLSDRKDYRGSGMSAWGTSVCIFNNALFRRKLEFLGPLETTALLFLASPLLAQDDNAHLESFVTQPPTTELSLVFVLCGLCPTQTSEARMREVRARVIQGNGITYRHLVDRFRREAHLLSGESGASEVEVDMTKCWLTSDAFSPNPTPIPGWITEWSERCRKELR